MAPSHVLVLDAGTTGVKALVFDRNFRVVARAYRRIVKSFPRAGWVEEDPTLILRAATAVLRSAAKQAGLSARSRVAMGITNQRETVVVWNKNTGTPIYPAIVWEDTRTAKECARLATQYGPLVRRKTGKPLIPYFTATKIRWVLDHVPAAKQAPLLAGTVDTWLMWQLLAGHPHVSDYTNANRTLLFNIRTLRWDKDLLRAFNVPPELLPKVLPSKGKFGTLREEVLGFPVPVLAVAGDQEASLFAAGHAAGTTKITYGTGTFVAQVIGARSRSKAPFFTTLAASGKKPLYALEAKVGAYGNAVDRLLAARKPLGPFFKTMARDADAYIKKLPAKPRKLILDGGMTQAPELMQIQSRASGVPAERQAIFDGTALGIAKMLR